MKLSLPGCTARVVTVASWPSKYRMNELSWVARYLIASAWFFVRLLCVRVFERVAAYYFASC
jgi:hypothetical protein